MPNAIGLYHFRWRKKKAKFIIPATHFRNASYSIVEVTQPKVTQPEVVAPVVAEVKASTVSQTITSSPVIATKTTDGAPKVSAFSLASIRAKKELESKQQGHIKHHDQLPTEKFTETDMLLLWNKFAQRLTDQGKRLMATYMQMNDPVLNDTTITLELPNQSTKEEFLTGYNELLGYLRGKLHNHDITIEVVVNEISTTKHAFTPIEKYEKLKDINPNLELLKKLFDLDV